MSHVSPGAHRMSPPARARRPEGPGRHRLADRQRGGASYLRIAMTALLLVVGGGLGNFAGHRKVPRHGRARRA